MRTEAEIKEAIELCKHSKCLTNDSINIRDSTIEALRFALGIDDVSTSPMSGTLKDLVDAIRTDIENNKQSILVCPSDQESTTTNAPESESEPGEPQSFSL